MAWLNELDLNDPQDTAKLEAESFVLKQKVALASELKSVLDSWVRYEQQAKEKEQAALAKTIIENVLKTIQDERTQKDILASAVAEVERECRLVFGVLPYFTLTVACVPVLQSWSSPRPFRVQTPPLAVNVRTLIEIAHAPMFRDRSRFLASQKTLVFSFQLVLLTHLTIQ